jgi:hypothetical protein
MKNAKMGKVDQLIDEFVTKLASSESIPARRIESAPWISDLAARLPKRFPRSFDSFVTRYSFPSIDLRGITFFGNSGDKSDLDLATAIFKDKLLCEVLLRSSHTQIGRPHTGDYDPICFEGTTGMNNREYPIARINHESVICYSRIGVTERVAPSFLQFVKNYLNPVGLSAHRGKQ